LLHFKKRNIPQFMNPILEYFLHTTDWVSQINVNAWFPIVKNYYNKKHEINQNRKQNRNRRFWNLKTENEKPIFE